MQISVLLMKVPEQFIIPSTVHSLTQQVVFFWANDALDQGAFKKTRKKLDTTCKNKVFMT